MSLINNWPLFTITVVFNTHIYSALYRTPPPSPPLSVCVRDINVKDELASRVLHVKHLRPVVDVYWRDTQATG